MFRTAATGRRVIAAAALALVALLGAGVLPAHASEAAYQHYAACGLSPKAKPARACPRDRPKAAFFRSRRAEVYFTVCVRFAAERTLCAKRQKAGRSVLYVNRITAGPGRHRITWFVEGKRVGRAFLRVNR